MAQNMKLGNPRYQGLASFVCCFLIQLNLFLVTIHSGDMEIAIDRWLLIAE